MLPYFFSQFSSNTKSILCVHNSQNQPRLPHRLDFQTLHCHKHDGKARKQSMGWRGGRSSYLCAYQTHSTHRACCLLGQFRAASELLYITLCCWSSLGRKAQPGYGPRHRPARLDASGACSLGTPALPYRGGNRRVSDSAALLGYRNFVPWQ